MRVTVISIIVNGFLSVHKRLERGFEQLEIRGRIETLQTTVLLKSDRLSEESMRPEDTCCHLDSSERPLANIGMKNSQIVASIEDSVDASIQRQEDYIKKRERRLITATRNDTDSTCINKTKITRKQKWEEKQLYGHFKQQTSDISH